MIAREELILFGFTAMIMFYLASVGIYYFEHQAQPEIFASVFHSFWWAVATLTTVGYGDIAPNTPFGQFIASVIMILGYAIIAIPTGIVSSEITKKEKISTNTQSCSSCSYEGHKDNAEYCYHCGSKLNL